jgi:TPR repeat protein
MKKLSILSLLLLAACSSLPPEQSTVLKLTNNLALSDIKTSLRLCEEKNYKECERAGQIYNQEKNITQAKIYLEKACNNQIGSACYYLGEMTPITSRETFINANKYLSQGCNLNDYFSCYYLAKLYLITLNGQSTKLPNHDLYIKETRRLLDKACIGRINSACLMIANDLRPFQNQQAEEIKDMCRSGLIEGCETTEK